MPARTLCFFLKDADSSPSAKSDVECIYEQKRLKVKIPRKRNSKKTMSRGILLSANNNLLNEKRSKVCKIFYQL